MAHPNGEYIYIIRGSKALEISDMVKYHVVEFDGLGMAPLHRISQRGPMQDGVTDVGYRLDPRTILISIMAYASTPAVFHDRRQELVDILKPGKTITLRWTFNTSSGTRTRSIDCHMVGGLSLPSSGMIQQSFNDVIQLYAPDPTFYDPEVITISPASLYSASSFTVPTVVPTSFGAVNILETVMFSHTDPGAWDIYPVATIKGPYTSCQIANMATSEWPNGNGVIYSSNAIAVGKTITIDFRYGVKSFTDETGASVLANWTGDRSTFKIGAGENPIRFFMTGIDANTRIQLQFNKRYIGL